MDIPEISRISPRQEQSGGIRLRGIALFSVLLALMLTLLLEALDQTVVGTALPQIVGELKGFDRYAWLVTVYLLASIAVIPFVGKLSDQFGRKRFVMVGVVVFLIGSALSGAAATMNQLIAFRALQGVGAGMGIALVFTVVGDIFPPAEQARWQSIFAGVYGFSNVVGPSVGGWLTDHGPLIGNLITRPTRWRWVFYLNLPLGVLALFALAVYLPSTISGHLTHDRGWHAVRRIDFIGALLAAAVTTCLLFGLTWGGNQTYNWQSAHVLGALISAGALYFALIIVERFVKEPMLPLDLFHSRVFAVDALLALLVGMILVPLVIYLPLFMQGVLGTTATTSGAAITPMTASIVAGSTLTGFAIARMGRYRLITIAGALLLAAGVVLMAQMTPSTTLGLASVALILAGVGLGAFFGMLTLVAQNSMPRERTGVGIGAITYLRSVGQAIGLAGVGTVITGAIRNDLPGRLPTEAAKLLTPEGLKAATDTHLLVDPAFRESVVHAVQNLAAASAPAGPQREAISQQALLVLAQVFDALKLSLAFALRRGFLTVFVFCVILLVASFFLQDAPLSKSWDETESGAAE